MDTVWFEFLLQGGLNPGDPLVLHLYIFKKREWKAKVIKIDALWLNNTKNMNNTKLNFNEVNTEKIYKHGAEIEMKDEANCSGQIVTIDVIDWMKTFLIE